MSKYRFMAVGAALAALGSGAAGLAMQTADAATPHTTAQSKAAVQVASVKVAVGSTNKAHQLLVTSSGKPIYLLTGDSKTHALCTSAGCLGAWPAVTTTSKKPSLGKGVKGTVAVWHHGRINQVTLNGHPLYTFASDSKGSAHGEGLKSFGGVWEVLNANGSGMAVATLKASTKSTSATSSTSSTSSAGSWS